MPRLALLADASSTHTLKWATAFAHRGWEVHVLSLCEATIPGVQVHPLMPPRVGKVGYLAASNRVRALVAKLAPDVLHAHYATSYGLLGSLTDFHPLVVSVWGSDVYAFPRKSPLHRALLVHNLRRADALTSSSRAMAQETARYAPGRDIQVIPFGVVPESYPLARPPEVPTIGCAKALTSTYGQADLLRALALLVARDPARPLRLLLAGDGEDRASLEALGANLGLSDRVSFLGRLAPDAIPAFMGGLSVFAMPSHAESFGVAALEAAACGVPVVASRVGGVPEVVKHEETGLLVPPGDPAALADALGRVLADPGLAARMGAAGRAMVRASYDFSRNADAMEGLYLRLRSPLC